jgi:hypothetical protein
MRVLNFHVHEDIICTGNVRLCSGYQARVLLKILNEYSHTGKTTFFNKDFCADKAYISSQTNPGFVTTLKRLMKRLETAACGIRIVKSGRGVFRLETDGAIMLTHDKAPSSEVQIFTPLTFRALQS